MLNRKLLPALLLAALPILGHAEVKYTVTSFRLDEGSYDTSGTDINNNGLVVGRFYDLGTHQHQGFSWSNGALQVFTSKIDSHYGTSVNEHGVITLVGGNLEDSYGSGFVLKNGQYTRMGSLAWGATTRLNALNNNGAAVGDSGMGVDTWSANAPRHALVYKDGRVTDLGTFGGRDSNALGINDAGSAVGWASTATGGSHAFIYQNGQMQDLGALGGRYSVATNINNAGAVVGYTGDNAGVQSSFLYLHGAVTSLGLLNGRGTLALDVNELGQVVGGVQGGNGAFLYSNGEMTDLNSVIDPASGLRITDARAINDHGQIVGQGCLAAGDCFGVLLNPIAPPVPEPGSYAMLLAGLGVIGWTRRKRNGATG